MVNAVGSMMLCMSWQAGCMHAFRDYGRTTHKTPRMLCMCAQVGCAQNCQFCLTGRMGLRANLSTGQIVEQARPFAGPAPTLLHCLALRRFLPPPGSG